ncbi:unnamed protein product [Allacma fusca]|uniref:Chitin-binding type-2 domain-containing protein n=1 Tax=Allacma fusca TaxID=39272 RepID=A0A8J2L2L5_9HEXA|nr:unnamed protein product [Allacma fusca]
MKTYICVLVVVSLLCITDAQRNKKRPAQAPTQEEYDDARKPGAVSEECPDSDGFFADAYQCDKYYQCQDGKATEKLCPDGLVFIDAGPKIEKCEFPFAVDCSGREELQPAKPSTNCPRKHGYFAHEDVTICDKFFFCVDGEFNAITCPAGLVFSNKTGTCTWPDQAKKQHCSSGELFEFECPKQEGDNPPGQSIHPRFADPKDCQFFFVCIDGKTPRKNGCSFGQVFNEASGQCDRPKNVPECKDWYKGQIEYDEFGDEITTRKPPTTPGAAGTRRKGVKRPVTPAE